MSVAIRNFAVLTEKELSNKPAKICEVITLDHWSPSSLHGCQCQEWSK